METLFQDIRFGVKLLWKEKGFAITAIVTLALCIGANATIFSVINAVVLSPLPTPESDRIVLMYNSYPKAGAERGATSPSGYYDRVRALDGLFEEQALYRDLGLTIGGDGSPERVDGMAVTPSFFRLLRVEPRFGRTFTEEEGEIGGEKKAVLSYALWQQRFGGDGSALGKNLRINDEPYTVVGVMPRDFLYLEPDTRVWIPLAFTNEETSDEYRHDNSWENIGRLRPGATLGQVRANLDALTAALYERFPEDKEILVNSGFHMQAHFLKDELVKEVRATLYLLGTGVFFVLLIGCVNITNLLLVRTNVRMKELAMRFALGAGRRRVVRQLLAESVLLSLLGALLGLMLGYSGLGLLRSLGLDEIPRGGEIAMTGTVTGVILVLSFLLGILMGSIPLAHVVRVPVNAALREEGRSGTSSRQARMVRNGLVVAQVAIAFILLVGAGLLLASFREVLALDPGFRRAESILTAQISLPETRYSEDTDLRSLTARVLERVRSIPGVVHAGATSIIPLGGSYSSSVIIAEGYEMKPGESVVSPGRITVTPDYFEAMGIPLVEGRTFDERDTEGALQTIIIDQQLARRFWPDGSALDKRLFRPSNPEDLAAITEDTEFSTVVGVVGNVRLRRLIELEEPVGAYYYPFEQNPNRRIGLTIRTATEPAGLVGTLRRELARIDPQLPLYDIHTMEERLDTALVARRSPMLVALVFGAVALFLSALGIYGVLIYLVSQRTKEIGIRVALGSDGKNVFRLILREGLAIVAIGFAIGIGGTLVMSRYIESLLFGVRPLDATVMVSGAAILSVVALVACSVPATRATRINPVEALNAE